MSNFNKPELKFFQLHRVLFENPHYKSLSIGGKVTYAILRDRLQLSVKNNFVDVKGEPYLLFTDKKLGELLNVNEKTARNYKHELIHFKLLRSERSGDRIPNRLYVLSPVMEQDKNTLPKTVEKTAHVGKNLPTNNTYINNTIQQQQQEPCSNIVNLLFETFGKSPTVLQLQELNNYLKRGMTPQAIDYAINKTGKVGANFLYLLAILRSWEKKGVSTLNQAIEEEQVHKERKVKHGKFEQNAKHRDELHW